MDVIQRVSETSTTTRTEFDGDQAFKASSSGKFSETEDGPTLIVHPVQRLSNSKLFILGTGQVFLWGLTSASILETAFALPVIGEEFHLTPGEVQWIAASMMLTWGCFQLIAGRLCDIFGRKRGYMIGCLGLMVTNIISTFMPNLASLNVFRALAGIASAIVLPASAGIIGSLYPAGRLRTLAFAAITCGGAAGAAGGELIAGILIEWTKWTWRPCFLLIGLLTIYPLVIGYLLIPLDPPLTADKAVDWLGAFAIGSSIFLLLLTFTLSQTQNRGWKTPYLPALLVVSGLLFVAFAWRQRQLSKSARLLSNKKPPPLIPLSLITTKNRNLLIIYIASASTWAMTDSFFVFVSYLYFDVLDLSPFQAGLKLSVTFFSGTFAALVVALTITHISPRVVMTLGCLISVASPVIFAVRGLDWAYWKGDLWALLVIAYGTDATIAAGSTIISQTASPEDQSVASALFQTSCRLGFALGLAISTLVQTSVEKSALSSYSNPTDDQRNHALVEGLRAAQWCNAGYIALAAVLVGFGMKGWQRLDHHEYANEGEDASEK
ncbi:hypothetical protein I302_106986 [Kwoniella bestiolae CBS 10118]|uniref:Major facilitator superfamily (MFS) profile domain-containing protein n=1 Tax=Kwoniella bestiolae CBS 10118 TaxID=1296100 RepID=A0A1B9FZV3_9TREE|nr:hypothetical protein I302_05750 [Kwoniella bestiolae CBS 10118]OCF24291.1 hypothetical protein I302_05750 [Kwoniella bestiolae CBS 10118]